MEFKESLLLNERMHQIIPGGAHTYAKGDDQFPSGCFPIMVKGKGCHVWDADGNEYIKYGMGLRSVTLGHAYETEAEAAYKQMLLGPILVARLPLNWNVLKNSLRLFREWI